MKSCFDGEAVCEKSAGRFAFVQHGKIVGETEKDCL